MKSNPQTIKCPECDAEIEISEVLSSQLEKDLRKTLKDESETALKIAVQGATEGAQKKSKLEITDLENQLKEREDESLLFRKKARELEAQKEGMEDEISRRVKDGEIALQKTLTDKIKNTLNQQKETEMLDLQSQIDDKNKNLEKAQDLELTLRKQARELEAKQKELDITLERKLDERAKKIECDLEKKYTQESDLRLKQKEQQIESLNNSVEDLKRKIEQGSQETQGEALEADLECRLKNQFSQDKVDAVGKGVRGADIIHTVINDQLKPCGKILWEAKNTKSWSQAWVQKLKDDQLASGANIAILVSVTLPQGLSSFEQIDGVWVCSPATAIALACALREQLMAVSFANLASVGKDEKMERMFTYLSGDEFRQRIEAIVSAFENMQLQIIRERRAMEKQWREREKQIDRIMINTSGMYGDMRGIIGSSVQAIQSLELDDSSEPDALESLDE
ncbi:MAG: DUF2130 domain-containing protein [Cocleimonas sp.]